MYFVRSGDTLSIYAQRRRLHFLSFITITMLLDEGGLGCFIKVTITVRLGGPVLTVWIESEERVI